MKNEGIVTFNFSEALKCLIAGRMLRRCSWDEGTFIFRQVPCSIHKDIVPKMTSLPPNVKKEFERRFNIPEYQITEIYYNNQVAMVNRSNFIQGYSPSVEDVFALDWMIYEPHND